MFQLKRDFHVSSHFILRRLSFPWRPLWAASVQLLSDFALTQLVHYLSYATCTKKSLFFHPSCPAVMLSSSFQCTGKRGDFGWFCFVSTFDFFKSSPDMCFMKWLYYDRYCCSLLHACLLMFHYANRTNVKLVKCHINLFSCCKAYFQSVMLVQIN